MNANQTLKWLLKWILDDGADVPSRVGSTKELSFKTFTVNDPQNRYITLPERRVSVPAQIAETMWVLAGRNDTEWLSAYLPQAPKFADDGKHWRAGYGPRLREFGSPENGFEPADQLKNVIHLLQDDPTTRRAVISIWDPTRDVMDSKDIPCNNWLHFLCRDGKLHLNIAIRSNDVMWGWSGINFFEWSVLLEIVAKHTGLAVGDLHFNVSSMHLYERHFEKAKRIVESPIKSHGTPGNRIEYNPATQDFDKLIKQWFAIEAEIREGELYNIPDMEEPLFRSWLWAMAYYWGHESEAKLRLQGFDIWNALTLSPKRKVPLDLEPLIDRMVKLHTEKSAAYGDSWKKRGELFSIIPNIARKVDRILAGTETSDETKLDTAMDLAIYLAKYSAWLNSEDSSMHEENLEIRDIVNEHSTAKFSTARLTDAFEELLRCVEVSSSKKDDALEAVIDQAVGYLVKLWSERPVTWTALRQEVNAASLDAIEAAVLTHYSGGLLKPGDDINLLSKPEPVLKRWNPND